MDTDWATRQKSVDPLNFVKVEDYFENLDGVASGGEQASTVSAHRFNADVPVNKRVLILCFDNGRCASLQFVRPTVWQMRCNFEPQEDPSHEGEST